MSHSADTLGFLRAMTLASTAASAMALFRVAYTGSFMYAWMIVPNLLLAWIPLVAALLLARPGGGILRTIGLGAVWLAFLPNAPYMVTDLVHLSLESHTGLFYFDAAMLTLFGFLGLYLGSAALHLVHHAVTATRRRATGWAFVALVCALCGVGVYLGRVERWNSWDLLRAPHLIIQSALKVFYQPDVTLFVAAMAILQLVFYVLFRQTARFAASESRD